MGARFLHVVVLDRTARVELVETVPVVEATALVEALVRAAAVAIDAPDRWSRAPHGGEVALAAKFRQARCAEIGLGRDYGLWVPWTTPCNPAEAAEWMHVGIRLFGAWRARGGHDPIEVYPYGAFRALNRFHPLPPKRTSAGRACRKALLAEAGVVAVDRLGESHDALDAAAAALVALHHLRGVARRATCGHDGSAIWLPAPVPALPSGVPEPARAPL